MTHSGSKSLKFWRLVIVLFSVIACALVIFLIYFPREHSSEPAWLEYFPAILAFLNSISFGLLIGAFYQIKRKNINNHKRLMLMALAVSVLFMMTYIIYHSLQTGPTYYQGDWRGIYFFLLITHIPLAALIVPGALFTVFRALNGDYRKHRKIARITFPVWLYVSVSGVLIYFMLI